MVQKVQQLQFATNKRHHTKEQRNITVFDSNSFSSFSSLFPSFGVRCLIRSANRLKNVKIRLECEKQKIRINFKELHAITLR